jgi:hypothetical protein
MDQYIELSGPVKSRFIGIGDHKKAAGQVACRQNKRLLRRHASGVAPRNDDSIEFLFTTALWLTAKTTIENREA